eukprot:gene3411-6772_t
MDDGKAKELPYRNAVMDALFHEETMDDFDFDAELDLDLNPITITNTSSATSGQQQQQLKPKLGGSGSGDMSYHQSSSGNINLGKSNDNDDDSSGNRFLFFKSRSASKDGGEDRFHGSIILKYESDDSEVDNDDDEDVSNKLSYLEGDGDGVDVGVGIGGDSHHTPSGFGRFSTSKPVSNNNNRLSSSFPLQHTNDNVNNGVERSGNRVRFGGLEDKDMDRASRTQIESFLDEDDHDDIDVNSAVPVHVPASTPTPFSPPVVAKTAHNSLVSFTTPDTHTSTSATAAASVTAGNIPKSSFASSSHDSDSDIQDSDRRFKDSDRRFKDRIITTDDGRSDDSGV